VPQTQTEPAPRARLDRWIGVGAVVALVAVALPSAWRGASGLILLGYVAFEHAKALSSEVRVRRLLELAALVAAGLVGTLALGLFDLAPGYFHQNGQGPLWVRYAMGLPSSYGPGQSELFGFVSGASNPDSALFGAQRVLGALWPLWAFVIARGLGAHRTLAWGFAVAVALDPVALRITSSETYFAGSLSMLLPATAALVLAHSSEARRSSVAVPALLAAGLLVAQAARVHPTGWVPAAFVVIAVALGPGQLRQRAMRTGLAALVVGAVVASVSYPAMADVLSGSLGQHWEGALGREHILQWRPLLFVCPVLIVLVALAKRRERALIAAVTMAVIVLLAPYMNLIGNAANRSIIAAYYHLYLPPMLACAVVLVSELRIVGPKPVTGALVGLLLAAWALSSGSAAAPSTDALEQTESLTWRATLPADAQVIYLARDGNRIQFLPYHRELGFSDVQLHAGEGADAILLAAVGSSSESYYQRTSLCAMPTLAEPCAEMEAASAAEGFTLEQVATASLPALPSMRDFAYAGETVDVTLFRLRAEAREVTP